VSSKISTNKRKRIPLRNKKKVTEENLPCKIIPFIAVSKSAELRNQLAIAVSYQPGEQVTLAKLDATNSLSSGVVK